MWQEVVDLDFIPVKISIMSLSKAFNFKNSICSTKVSSLLLINQYSLWGREMSTQHSYPEIMDLSGTIMQRALNLALQDHETAQCNVLSSLTPGRTLIHYHITWIWTALLSRVHLQFKEPKENGSRAYLRNNQCKAGIHPEWDVRSLHGTHIDSPLGEI